jgi:NADPH:quinone reductase-like Zn-dependent oxidoreductase
MKAIVCEKYGSPKVLELHDVEKPIPGNNEVLVRVHAVSVNPFEWHHIRGKPYFARLTIGFFKPKHKILGNDVAGVVEALGKGVNNFQPGDKVFGGDGYGGLAEYVLIPEDKLVQIPDKLSFSEAASMPIAAITALQGLRDYCKILPKSKVLINGASGGVGTFAVQIAKVFGAEVTGVCSTRNLKMVSSIGADHVIDYTMEDFTKKELKYDLIYDAVGNLKLKDIRNAIKPDGIGVVAGFTTVKNMLSVALFGKSGKRKIYLMSAKITHEDLNMLGELAESGKVKPVIDREYPLVKTAEAISYLEEGHARGKVIINLETN